MTGIELIAQERAEQLLKHNRSIENDVAFNNHYQLSQAAGLLVWVGEEDYGHDTDACCPTEWDPALWKKMMEKDYADRLVIAGALIAAEIDRLQHSKTNNDVTTI